MQRVVCRRMHEPHPLAGLPFAPAVNFHPPVVATVSDAILSEARNLLLLAARRRNARMAVQVFSGQDVAPVRPPSTERVLTGRWPLRLNGSFVVLLVAFVIGGKNSWPTPSRASAANISGCGPCATTPACLHQLRHGALQPGEGSNAGNLLFGQPRLHHEVAGRCETSSARCWGSFRRPGRLTPPHSLKKASRTCTRTSWSSSGALVRPDPVPLTSCSRETRWSSRSMKFETLF